MSDDSRSENGAMWARLCEQARVVGKENAWLVLAPSLASLVYKYDTYFSVPFVLVRSSTDFVGLLREVRQRGRNSELRIESAPVSLNHCDRRGIRHGYICEIEGEYAFISMRALIPYLQLSSTKKLEATGAGYRRDGGWVGERQKPIKPRNFENRRERAARRLPRRIRPAHRDFQ